MKKVLLGIGAAVIAVLLLLQTKFNIYGQLFDEGYAVVGDEVRQMLSMNPIEGVEITKAPMYRFNVLDYIYSRGKGFYMGEEKKTEVDLGFPMLINDGAGVLFLNQNDILFDEDFDTIHTYDQLRVVDGYAYNADGTQADAAFYTFAGLTNGFFVNFDYITYMEQGEEREVIPNSFMTFKPEYFAYGMLNGEELDYRACIRVHDWTPIWVGEDRYTYHDLLLYLGVISDPKEDTGTPVINGTGDEGDNEEGLIEGDFEYGDLITSADAGSAVTEKKAKKEKDKAAAEKAKNPEEKKKKTVKDKVPAPAPEAPQRPSAVAPTVPSERPPRTNSNTAANPNISIGVRPDEMRPDKAPREEGNNNVPYVKPTVTVEDPIPGVYRIRIPVTVSDPASRIHPKKRVQFEFYEQRADGTEKFVYRTYTSSTGTVTGGGGAIKPGTTYRVVGYFTYYDERERETVESLMDTLITTKPFESLGTIKLTNSADGIEIPYFYDNHLEIPNLKYDLEASDEEAIYGIAQVNGMKIHIQGKGQNSNVKSDHNLEANNLRIIKNGSAINWITNPNLKPNGQYSYHIDVVDYFGNALELVNPDGDFETCKSRPTATIEIVKNEIKDIQASVRIFDTDLSAIPTSQGSTDYDIYFVVMLEDSTTVNPLTKEECDQYLVDGSNNHGIGYLHKFTKDEYWHVDPADGSVVLNVDKIYKMEKLKLAKKYRAFVYMDYNLNNGRGDVRFDLVGSLLFTSASLNSLGRVYVNIGAADITAHEVDLMYTLNTERTNPMLAGLLSKMSFQLVRTGGADPINDLDYSFSSAELDAFKAGTGINIPKEYFKAAGNTPLKSMTEYMSTGKVFGVYDGEEYELMMEIEGGAFKTLREPAKVEVTDALLAAGTLRFNARILDPDDAITGNSGHKVILNIYEANGRLLTAMRLDKAHDESEDPIPVEIKTTSTKLVLDFVAAEYNEGYTNATYEANKLLKELTIVQTVDLSGSIKLKTLTPNHDRDFVATTVITIEDKGKNMLKYPYHVKVERDGVEQNGFPEEYAVALGDYTENTIKHTKSFNPITKGDHTYKMTLYVVINNQILVLDTLEFTSEEEVDSIESVDEFIWKTYHYPDKKFAVLCDLMAKAPVRPIYPAEPQLSDYANTDLYNAAMSQYYQDVEKYDEDMEYYEQQMLSFDPYLLSNTKFTCPIHENKGSAGALTYNCTAGQTKTMSRHTDLFSGKIDFQGYTFRYAVMNSGASMFTKLNDTAQIYNLAAEYQIRVKTTYDGIICQTNYGYIHDINLKYTGGNRLSNEYDGMACYLNSASGVIENFVVSNEPEAGLFPYTARYYVGLLVDYNFGRISNGYAYGDKIYADTMDTPQTGLSIGGIVGRSGGTGKINNVFSLVDVIAPDRTRKAGTDWYSTCGSVIGNGGSGRLNNVYGIGESYFLAGNTMTDSSSFAMTAQNKYVNNTIGPVVGAKNARMRDIYYYYEDDSSLHYRTAVSGSGTKYTNANSVNQTRVSLETLYDYNWQRKLLGSMFDATPVEVGYYPQLRYSDELPAQDYIPMPARSKSNPVDLMSANVLEYYYGEKPEDIDSALVSFRFSNTKNYDILGLEIEGIKNCVLDYTTVKNEDGYTTIQGIISDPTVFLSKYEVKNVTYANKGKNATLEFSIRPVLMADFYRRIYTTTDWYNYVVLKPEENARIMNDLDFAGVDKAYIRVTTNYTGKLIGGFDAQGVGKALKNITITTIKKDDSKDRPRIFETLYYGGEIRNLVVENLTFNNTGNATPNSAFVYNDYGEIDNVHMKNVTIDGNYGRIGGIVCNMSETATVSNSSVNGFKVRYREPYNSIVEGRVGGIAASVSNGYIVNTYARDLDIECLDMSESGGVGGIAGNVGSSIINGVYTTGLINVQGINVGGVIGYYTSYNYSGSLLNIMSKADVICSQDKVGGIIGASDNKDIINGGRTGFSGIALGNVNCKNPMAEDNSYIIGSMMDYTVYFYGAKTQLLNGLPYVEPAEDSTADKDVYLRSQMLSKEQIMDPAIYTGTIKMQEVFAYDMVKDNLLPNLYYENSSVVLPFQEEGVLLAGKKQVDNPIKPLGVTLVTNNRRILIDVDNPKGLSITDVYVKDLKYSYDAATTEQYKNNRIVLYYNTENTQEHWYDSYDMLTIAYKDPVSGVTGTCDYSLEPVVIPLTLYREINTIEQWNAYFNQTNNYGNYENYKLKKDIVFQGSTFNKNVKVGRLIGDSDNGANIKLSQINIGASSKIGTYTENGVTEAYWKLSGANENLILGLSAEMANITFEDVNIVFASALRTSNSGIVGTSSANVHNVVFNNITIDNAEDNRHYTGCIGKQNGGMVYDITMNNIKIATKAFRKTSNKEYKGTKQNYTGALIGLMYYNSTVQNVTANDIEIIGGSRTGGIVGSTEGHKGSFVDIHVTDVKVSLCKTSTDSYVGGIIGYTAPGYSGGRGSKLIDLSIDSTPAKCEYDADGYIIKSGTVIDCTYGSYVGGIVGYCNTSQTGYLGDGSIANMQSRRTYNRVRLGVTTTADTANVATNIIVKGTRDYAGGAYGYGRYVGNTKVKNVLVTNKTNVGDTVSRLGATATLGYGGIVGYHRDNTRFMEATNVHVDVINGNRIGGVSGQLVDAGEMQDCYVITSLIEGDETGSNASLARIAGGLVGWSNRAISVSVVENTIVKAPKYDAVGGVVGLTDSTVNKCVYYAMPQAIYTLDAAKTGNSGKPVTQWSEGLTGAAMTINYRPEDYNSSYTEAHSASQFYVKGDNNVGGVVGEIRAGTTARNMSNANVIAMTSKAGGIGGMYTNGYTTSVLDGKDAYSYSGVGLIYNIFAGDVYAKSMAGGAIGASSMTTDTKIKDVFRNQGGRTSDINPTVNIKSGTNNEVAYTYSNLILANRVASADNNHFAFCGSLDGLEGAPNNYNAKASFGYLSKKYQARRTYFWAGTKLEKRATYEDAPSISNMLYSITETGNKTAYKYSLFDEKTSSGANLYGFDEKTDQSSNVRLVTDKDIRDPYMYLAMDLREGTKADPIINMKNRYTLLFLGKVTNGGGSDAEWAKLSAYKARYKDGTPVGFALLPHVRTNENNAGQILDIMTEYQLKRNLNLPLPKRGTTITGRSNADIVLAPGEVVDYTDTSLVAAYPVDASCINIEFKDSVVNNDVPYTVAYGNKVVAEGVIENRVMTFQFDFKQNVTVTLGGESEFVFKAMALRTPVMTHKTEYYYISEHGVVHGSTASNATTLEGEFIHLNKGKALTKSGDVIDIATGKVVATVEGMEETGTKSIQDFTTEGMLVHTYAGFSEIETGAQTVIRELQLLASANGATGSVASGIDNVKTAVVLHRTANTSHLVTLGMDARIADIYGEFGKEFMLPEDFVNKGIVHMSNNLNTTAPFLLVEYSNGGMVGINYVTGEYLFNNYIKQEVSLFDYIMHYFDGEKPVLSELSSGYMNSQAIIDVTGNVDRLYSAVNGDPNPDGGNANNQSKDNGEHGEEPGEKIGDVTDEKTVGGQDSDAGADHSDEEAGEGSELLEDTNLSAIGDESGANVAGENYTVTGESTGNGMALGNGSSLYNGDEALDEADENAILDGMVAVSGDGDSTGDDREGHIGTVGGHIKDEAEETTEEEGSTEAVEETEVYINPDLIGNTSPVLQGSAGTIIEETENGRGPGSGSKNDADAEDAESDDKDEEAIDITIKDETNKANSEDKEELVVEDTTEEEGTAVTGEDDLTIENANFGNLMTVYNVLTGTYEIVDMSQYLTKPNYVSENAELNIKDFSDIIDASMISAEGEKESANLNGLILYILVAVAILMGVAFTMEFRQKRRKK